MQYGRTSNFVLRWTVLAISLLTLSGCSFIFVRGPAIDSSGHPSKDVKCTSSVASPVVDSVIAAAFIVGTVSGGKYGAYVRVNGDGASDTSILVDLTGAATFTASALYGYSVTSSCSAAEEQLRREQPAQKQEQVKAAQKQEQVNSVTGGTSVTGRPSPPVQAAGFTFGWKAKQAEAACIGADGQWDATLTHRGCSKTLTEVGFAGEVALEFWHGRVKRVTVTRKAADEKARALMIAFTRVKDLLTTEYGKPDQLKDYIPPTCHTTLAECLRNHRVQISARWFWPNLFEIVVNLSATDVDVVLALEQKAIASVEPLGLESAEPSTP